MGDRSTLFQKLSMNLDGCAQSNRNLQDFVEM